MTSEFGYMNTMYDSSVWVPVLRTEMSVYSPSQPTEGESCCVSNHSWTSGYMPARSRLSSSLLPCSPTELITHDGTSPSSHRRGALSSQAGWLIRHREVWEETAVIAIASWDHCHIGSFTSSSWRWLEKVVGDSSPPGSLTSVPLLDSHAPHPVLKH